MTNSETQHDWAMTISINLINTAVDYVVDFMKVETVEDAMPHFIPCAIEVSHAAFKDEFRRDPKIS